LNLLCYLSLCLLWVRPLLYNAFFLERALAIYAQRSGMRRMVMLVVLGNVQAQYFFLVAYTQRVDVVDQLEQAVGHGEAVGHYQQHAQQLVPEQLKVAIEQTVYAGTVDGGGGKNTGEQHTAHTSYTVAGEYIQRIVNAGFGFPVHHQVRYNSGGKTDENTLGNSYKASGRRNGHQAYYRAYAKAQSRRLSATDHIKEHPGNTCGGGCRIGSSKSGNGQLVSSYCRTDDNANPA